MATLYCPECCHKNEYTLHPPNFCGGCGIKMGDGDSSEKAPLRQRGKSKKPDFAEASDSDETDIEHVPDINKLDVDISYEGQARIFKGKDFIPTPEEDLSDRAGAN